jgi:hypothetical protein
MKKHQYWLIYIVILCISSCSEETPSIDTTNAVTTSYLESVGIDLITGEFEQIAHQQHDISKLVGGNLAKQVQFDANSLDFLYPKNIYFYVTTIGNVCVSGNLSASIDKYCYNKLDNLGYSFFTALGYNNTTTTPHQHILNTNSLTYYVALFTDQQQTASYFSLKNLPSLNNLFIEVVLYLDAEARADDNLKLYLHYGDYGMVVEHYNNSQRKVSIHHGVATNGQTYPVYQTQYIDNNSTSKLTLKIQLSGLHTSKNSDDTYVTINDQTLALANNYMTLANPQDIVDFTITAYKNSGYQNYKVLLKSIKICDSAC